jgi:atypical dual specificity phosphatase
MTISQVTEHLYIGNFYAAGNEMLLKSCGITHIVVAAAGLPARFPQQFEYLKVELYDLVEFNIMQHFSVTNEFIAKAETQGKVFVHCAMGISRSSTIVLAYLMYKNRWKATKALRFLKSKHPDAQPNIGFMQQLKSYEGTLGDTNAQLHLCACSLL